MQNAIQRPSITPLRKPTARPDVSAIALDLFRVERAARRAYLVCLHLGNGIAHPHGLAAPDLPGLIAEVKQAAAKLRTKGGLK